LNNESLLIIIIKSQEIFLASQGHDFFVKPTQFFAWSSQANEIFCLVKPSKRKFLSYQAKPTNVFAWSSRANENFCLVKPSQQKFLSAQAKPDKYLWLAEVCPIPWKHARSCV
jgi:hypothetical protein